MAWLSAVFGGSSATEVMRGPRRGRDKGAIFRVLGLALAAGDRAVL